MTEILSRSSRDILKRFPRINFQIRKLTAMVLLFPRDFVFLFQNHLRLVVQHVIVSMSTKKDEPSSTLPSHFIRTAKTHLPPRPITLATSTTVDPRTVSNTKPVPAMEIEDSNGVDDETMLDPFQERETQEEEEADCALHEACGFAVTCSVCKVSHLIENLHSSLVPVRIDCRCTTHHSKQTTCVVTVLLNSSCSSKKGKRKGRE